jgi:hypothetical protein
MISWGLPYISRRALGRTATVVTIVAGALFAAQTARASGPTVSGGSFDVASTVTTICPFPVAQAGHITYTERDYADSAGRLSRAILNVAEQDTFSANGVSVTTDLYHYTLFQSFDAQGNFTDFHGSGVIARIDLPGGGLFLSAGKLSLLPDPNKFFFTPDVGRSGDVTAFCDSFTS